MASLSFEGMGHEDHALPGVMAFPHGQMKPAGVGFALLVARIGGDRPGGHEAKQLANSPRGREAGEAASGVNRFLKIQERVPFQVMRDLMAKDEGKFRFALTPQQQSRPNHK